MVGDSGQDNYLWLGGAVKVIDFLGVGSIPYHSQNGGYMGVDTF